VAAIVLEGFTRPSFELFGSALDRFVMFKMSYCWLWHPLGEFTVIVDEIILYRFCFQSDEGYLAHHARLQCFNVYNVVMLQLLLYSLSQRRLRDLQGVTGQC